MRIVALGGGAGPSLAARAYADHLANFTALVCTTDRGSSTGICREAFGIPAPGDIRATLCNLAMLSGRGDWGKVWEMRLNCPGVESLSGMALGNLIISGLIQKTGDLARAVEEAAELLEIAGKVLPVTAESADVEAELQDGSIVQKEPGIRKTGKAPIRRLRWMGSTPEPAPGALEALARADLILIGPGCLYTSVLPCLMVRGVSEAILRSRALRIYICNTTTTPGQTDGLTVLGHVEILRRMLGRKGLDAVLVNLGRLSKTVIGMYQKLGITLLHPAEQELRVIREMGVRVAQTDLLEDSPSRPRALHKTDTIRHDPVKLRQALEAIFSSS